MSGSVTPAPVNVSYCQVPGGCTVTFVQGAGAYAVTWPSNVYGGFQIGTINGKKNMQLYTTLDGSNMLAVTPGLINQ